MSSSPIQKISENLFIKCDNMLPLSFGGNKYRIANEYMSDLKSKNCNCLIGYGNTSSNLNRVLAFLCRQNNIPCYIISPIDKNQNNFDTFNSKLCKISNAEIVYCSKDNVAQTVENVINNCKAQGYNPYYINGDKYGHGNEQIPVKAYEKAYNEIIDEDDFDYIFLATGTGMTQAGLLAGKLRFGGKAKIVGISIARKKEQDEQTINLFLQRFLKTDKDFKDEIEVDDGYIIGGYGKYDSAITDTINYAYNNYGIPLDTTYTGKAFYGMLNYIKKHKLNDKKILFLHTGGTPNFFDYLNTLHFKNEIKECGSVADLLLWLKKIDSLLTTPLSERTDLKEYAIKVLKYGKVLAIYENNEIVSAICFYCNDFTTYQGYITLLATLPEYGNRHFASCLIGEAEKYLLSCGMKTFALHTDITNNKAVALYSKNGFIIHSVDKKIFMVKELDQ